MAYIWLTEKEQVKILNLIIEFLKNPESIMEMSDDILPVYKILDYFVTDIPLLSTLKIEMGDSYAEIIASDKNREKYEMISKLLSSAKASLTKYEKRKFMQGFTTKKKK